MNDTPTSAAPPVAPALESPPAGSDEGGRASGARIVRVETIRPGRFPNVLFVRLVTDAGPIGLGETFYGAGAVEAYVHESVAPRVLGQDPGRVDALSGGLEPYVGYAGTGAEARGRSACNIALWDLLGKTAGLPLYRLLGGPARDRIRIYNTCAGYDYVRTPSGQSVANWGIDAAESGGPYEDLTASLMRPAELARSLLDQGITAMKIWPFDRAAEANGGVYLSRADLAAGLEPIRKIRAAVGDQMEVMVELHGQWNLLAAWRIARALEELDPLWIEDPLRPDSIEALAELAGATSIPLAIGETLSGVRPFRELIDSGAPRILTPDLGWSGGITQALKIAALADARQLPVAIHDCTGPVGLVAASHLAIHLPNALMQETVRAFYTGWYRELVSVLPRIEDGWLWPPDAPGLGTELLPSLLAGPDVNIRVSEFDDLSDVAPIRGM